MRRLITTVLLAFSATALAACGAESVGYGDDQIAGWDAFDVSGDFGASLEVSWNGELAYPDETLTQTLIEGDGDTPAEGDTLDVWIYIGDGTTQKEAYSDFTNGASEQMALDSTLGDFWTSLLTGAKVGTRVAAITTSADIFGAAGNASMGVGTTDAMLVVVDITGSTPAPEPVTPEDVDPGALPSIITDGDAVTGLDFTGIAEPTADDGLKRVIVTKGSGEAVKATDTITANYYGTTYGQALPFDESYSTGQPLTIALSGLIQGWQDGLVGVPVGSRVILQIPASLGYQDSEQPARDEQHSGIPANSTLYFVLDIIGVSAS